MKIIPEIKLVLSGLTWWQVFYCNNIVSFNQLNIFPNVYNVLQQAEILLLKERHSFLDFLFSPFRSSDYAQCISWTFHSSVYCGKHQLESSSELFLNHPIPISTYF